SRDCCDCHLAREFPAHSGICHREVAEELKPDVGTTACSWTSKQAGGKNILDDDALRFGGRIEAECVPETLRALQQEMGKIVLAACQGGFGRILFAVTRSTDRLIEQLRGIGDSWRNPGRYPQQHAA